jgi:hypoxanthine phosphoribosyltransferase
MATLTWEQYHSAVLKLIKNMGEYRPDIIVPCMIGGMFVGIIVAKEFGINDVRPIDIERKGQERRLAYDMQGDIQGKKVLILEDDLPTGKGPVMVKEIFVERGAKVKIAAVYVNDVSVKVCDFYTEVCKEFPNYPYKTFHAGDRLRNK